MKFSIEEVPEFYRNYIEQVENQALVPMLLKSGDDLVGICRNLTEQRALYRYEQDKWSIKDIIQHLIDSERIFAYRSLRFARNDDVELQGFDQNEFVSQAEANRRRIHALLSEFTNL